MHGAFWPGFRTRYHNLLQIYIPGVTKRIVCFFPHWHYAPLFLIFWILPWWWIMNANLVDQWHTVCQQSWTHVQKSTDKWKNCQRASRQIRSTSDYNIKAFQVKNQRCNSSHSLSNMERLKCQYGCSWIVQFHPLGYKHLEVDLSALQILKAA